MVENEYPDFPEHLSYMIEIATPGMLINAVVDLSHWNGNVNLKLAKEDGVVGIIHISTQGVKYIDPEYADRKKAA
ncbi:muramidase, partial [Wolbachia endosymbiont of Atemnus politus]|nr:muramidase [Wolbachia endosymbiont of Atemnus politus]